MRKRPFGHQIRLRELNSESKSKSKSKKVKLEIEVEVEVEGNTVFFFFSNNHLRRLGGAITVRCFHFTRKWPIWALPAFRVVKA